jgi:hypothetical protein
MSSGKSNLRQAAVRSWICESSHLTPDTCVYKAAPCNNIRLLIWGPQTFLPPAALLRCALSLNSQPTHLCKPANKFIITGQTHRFSNITASIIFIIQKYHFDILNTHYVFTQCVESSRFVVGKSRVRTWKDVWSRRWQAARDTEVWPNEAANLITRGRGRRLLLIGSKFQTRQLNQRCTTCKACCVSVACQEYKK